MRFTRLSFSHTGKFLTRLKMPVRDKHSNLLRTFEHSSLKKFYNIGAHRKPRRKYLLGTLLFALLALIGSAILANALGYGGDLRRVESDNVKNILAQNPEGKFYYPYWPLFPLVSTS